VGADHVPIEVADTDMEAREGAAWFVSFFATTSRVYRDSLVRQGYGKAVQAVLSANESKFTGVVPTEAEELLEQLVVFGTPSEARRRLERWHKAGADFPVLLLRPKPHAGGALARARDLQADAPTESGHRQGEHSMNANPP